MSRRTMPNDNAKDLTSSGFTHALKISEHLLDHAEEMDFQYILNEMTSLCGARFGVMNLFDPDGLTFHTVAVSGASSLLRKGMSLLGFNPFDKKWAPDPKRNTFLEKTAITRYDTLSEMTVDVIPRRISNLLTATFQLGNVFLLKVASSTELLGDITLLMRKDDEFAHEEVVTLCLHQIGNALYRYRSEENLIYSRKFAHAILETSKDGFWLLDASNGRILDVNETYCLLSGYGRSELMSMRISDLEVEETPADTAEHIRKIRRIGSDRFQTKHRRKDGVLFDVDVTVTWMDGEKPCFICFCRDITSRLEAEEALRESEIKRNALFTSMAEMVVLHELVCDEQGKPVNYRITDCNDAFSKTTGILRENALDRLATEVFGTVDPPYLSEYAEVALSGEPGIYETHFSPMDKFYLVSVVSLGKKRFATVTTDITAQKHAEEAVRNARNQYQSLIENIPGITFRCKNDPDWTMIFLSGPVEAITGYTADELVGNALASYASLIHPDDVKPVTDVIMAGLAAQQNWEVEYRLLHKDGSLRWVYEKGSAVLEDNGAVLFLAGFILDVTGEKLAELRLQESEERFDRAVAGTGAGLWDWDMVKNTVYFSPLWKSMLGYEEYEVANDFSGWKRLWHPDEIVMIETAINDFLEEKTAAYEIEHRLLRKDGSWQWILTRGDIIKDSSGKPVRWTGTNIDIHERKQMEKALERERNLFTAGPVFTIERAPTDGWPVRMVSSNVTANLGYTLAEMKSDSFTYASLVHPEDLEKIKQEVMNNIENHVDAYEQSYRLKTKAGEYRWFYDFTKLIRNEKGGLTAITGYMYDQTVQKEAQEALKIAKEHAESANKAKSQFLANMSHEIRTPLNGVIGFTELLMGTPLSPMQQQYASNAHVSGNLLLGIVNDILDFSKIEAGMMNLEIIRTDMVELVENSVDVIKQAAEKKSLEVLLDIDLSMPRFAMADPVRLQQILGNLLGNAIKFTENGEVELKVTYVASSEDKGTFSFSIRDTGIGISESQMDRLFKAFSQADGSTTRKFGGTGLGLVISDLLAREMGSRIDIDSMPGEGSVFHFNLTTDILEDDQTDMPALEGIRRCLIIDDNANNRMILEHFLSRWHIETASCDNGLSALKFLEDARPFDVIICDYHMPPIDGLETIRLIREKLGLGPEEQPIFLLHASTDDSELHRNCDELGVRFRLTKPVRSRELHRALSSLNIQPKQPSFSSAATPLLEEDRTEMLHNAELQRVEPQIVAIQKDEPQIVAIQKDEPQIVAIQKDEPQIVTPQNMAPEGAESKTVTILIADDVQINMKLVKALIHRLLPNAVLLEAENGLKALEVYRESKPDLILMDVQMPEMDGIEAAKTIRILEGYGAAHTPIVALSAGVLKEEKELCQAAGMDDFLAKPLAVDKLKALIEKMVDRKKPAS